MRTAAAAVLQAALCTALRAPVRHRTTLKASTQPFVYDNADTLAGRYAEYERVCQQACDDDAAFSTFKAQEAYQDVLEHVSYDVGRCYEHRLKVDHPTLFEDQGIRGLGDIACDIQQHAMFAIATLDVHRRPKRLLQEFHELGTPAAAPS